MHQSFRDDAIPAQVREFLELFATDCAELRFPDVDVEAFEQLAEVVCERQQAVDAARAELERRREALKLGQEALRSRSTRALAYLRIYATSHPELSTSLDDLALARSEQTPKPRKRRRSTKRNATSDPQPQRPKRAGTNVAELPLAGAGQEEGVRGAA